VSKCLTLEDYENAFADAKRYKAERNVFAAAIRKVMDNCTNCDGKGVLWFRSEKSDGSWGEARKVNCSKCGSLPDPTSVLGEDAKDSKDMRIDELEAALERLRAMAQHYGVTDKWTRDEVLDTCHKALGKGE
jgi:hypothetical protein